MSSSSSGSVTASGTVGGGVLEYTFIPDVASTTIDTTSTPAATGDLPDSIGSVTSTVVTSPEGVRWWYPSTTTGQITGDIVNPILPGQDVTPAPSPTEPVVGETVVTTTVTGPSSTTTTTSSATALTPEVGRGTIHQVVISGPGGTVGARVQGAGKAVSIAQSVVVSSPNTASASLSECSKGGCGKSMKMSRTRSKSYEVLQSMESAAVGNGKGAMFPTTVAATTSSVVVLLWNAL